jgi:hypothetical protein
VRYRIDGPVRDIVVCHCGACVEATGGPWSASAVARDDLTVAGETAVRWERAPVSEHDARRGSCRTCGTVLFWDAPGRATVSFAADTLADGSELQIAAKIWLGENADPEVPTAYPRGLPATVVVPWRG